MKKLYPHLPRCEGKGLLCLKLKNLEQYKHFIQRYGLAIVKNGCLKGEGKRTSSFLNKPFKCLYIKNKNLKKTKKKQKLKLKNYIQKNKEQYYLKVGTSLQ